MKKLLSILCFTFVAVGCSSVPDYERVEQEGDATVSFVSNSANISFYVEGTTFPKAYAGYLGNFGGNGILNLFGLVKEGVRQIDHRIPANDLITVQGSYYYSDNIRTTKCGPTYARFKSEANKEYWVDMTVRSGQCGITVTDKMTDKVIFPLSKS